MYPGAKKVSIFSKKNLTRRIPSECLTSFSAKNSENPLTRRILPVQSLVTGHWSLVTGHWSLVTGHWSLVTGHWSLVTP